jgi:DNA-binding MarR family transcriptional regulator
MGDGLRQRLRMSRMESPAQEALLALLVAAGHVRDRLDELCRGHDITYAQYNVLRILRGAEPDGRSRGDIARRMIERGPDLTRLIDRLVRRGLAERSRSSDDKRRSITRITRRGLERLERMRPSLAELQRDLTQRYSAAELAVLTALCERLFEGAPERPPAPGRPSRGTTRASGAS